MVFDLLNQATGECEAVPRFNMELDLSPRLKQQDMLG